MYFDLLPDSSSLPQMTTNYGLLGSLGCLKQALIATPLLTTVLATDTSPDDIEGDTDVL